MLSIEIPHDRSSSNFAATVILTPMIPIRITPYAAAVPRLKSRNSEAMAIETGRFPGTNTSTEATYGKKGAEGKRAARGAREVGQMIPRAEGTR